MLATVSRSSSRVFLSRNLNQSILFTNLALISTGPVPMNCSSARAENEIISCDSSSSLSQSVSD